MKRSFSCFGPSSIEVNLPQNLYRSRQPKRDPRLRGQLHLLLAGECSPHCASGGACSRPDERAGAAGGCSTDGCAATGSAPSPQPVSQLVPAAYTRGTGGVHWVCLSVQLKRVERKSHDCAALESSGRTSFR